MMLRPLTRSVRFDAERRCGAKSLGIALVVGLCLISGIQPATAITTDNKQTELYKIYTHIKLSNHKEYSCINTLWTKESNWSPTAKNKKSSAYGIPQLLNLTTTDPYLQIDAGIKYIRNRYGTTCNALTFFKVKGYY
jgi:hypothetical protein